MEDKDKDDLVASLTSPSQRLVKVYVGDCTEHPFHVQQQLLEALSEVFENALKRDTFAEGITGVLRFPEDEMDVWEVFLYWTFNHDFPGHF
ncbi:hypothetical protein TI39_contig348g00009 [Zymoseptoria brevis]|uniref:BTB domain-containing protein n=1 Tax=Zymoseptoria brevis TaxID=1047168 RepID=A0A0F4GUK8_9PEZI|nr:hypothetical protein TI39_contig348g00009 [Zymoseptoria brevis]